VATIINVKAYVEGQQPKLKMHSCVITASGDVQAEVYDIGCSVGLNLPAFVRNECVAEPEFTDLEGM
jgi:hypothetical protein